MDSRGGFPLRLGGTLPLLERRDGSRNTRGLRAYVYIYTAYLIISRTALSAAILDARRPYPRFPREFTERATHVLVLSASVQDGRYKLTTSCNVTRAYARAVSRVTHVAKGRREKEEETLSRCGPCGLTTRCAVLEGTANRESGEYFIDMFRKRRRQGCFQRRALISSLFGLR